MTLFQIAIAVYFFVGLSIAAKICHDGLKDDGKAFSPTHAFGMILFAATWIPALIISIAFFPITEEDLDQDTDG